MNLQKFRDDAFLYKDLTQWIRRQTFLPFFFGMLVAGEVITLMVFASSSGPSGGQAILTLLLGLLSIYGVLIALQCCADTFRERSERLFEIHMLSGIRPRALVRGKLLSMVVQFVFGLSCLVPYMFFAVMQGSVGYIELFGSLFGILVSFLLLALWAIMTGLVVGGLKSTIGRLATFIGLLWGSQGGFYIGGYIIKGSKEMMSLSVPEFILAADAAVIFAAIGVWLLFGVASAAVPYGKQYSAYDPTLTPNQNNTSWALLHAHEYAESEKKTVSTDEPQSNTA